MAETDAIPLFDDNPEAFWSWIFGRDVRLSAGVERRNKDAGWPRCEQEIRREFRRRLIAFRVHPDLGGSASEFRELMKQRDEALIRARSMGTSASSR